MYNKIKHASESARKPKKSVNLCVFRAKWGALRAFSLLIFISRVQMKSWAGKALKTFNCCAFLQRGLIGAS
jgi:hypothetical protein